MTSQFEPPARSAPNPAHRAPSGRTGWLAGIVIGVVLVLLALPPARYTLLAQFQFALAERSLPFLHAVTVRPSKQEIRILDSVASASPDDYLIQVGRATVLAAEGGLRGRQAAAGPQGDNTLYRLGSVVEHFASAPGAYAHLSRYMMNERVRLERLDSSERGIPHQRDESGTASATRNESRLSRESGGSASHHGADSGAAPDRDDVRMMEWALRAGEKRDPDNAFWPMMLATTYFAAYRDEDGQEALRRASQKTRWDAYIYEEILGEWRLFSTAYGDNGAMQKIGPLSLVSFPHLGEIRKTAQFVRYLADKAAAAGDEERSVRLRGELLLVGGVMRTRAQWAYEALIGTDVCMTAATDSDAKIMPGRIRSETTWFNQAHGYMDLLKSSHHNSDIAWIRHEVGECCSLRNRIDLARYDASYPGIPPGIPLAPLFGSWMMCVSIIQQVITLVGVVLLMRVLAAIRSRRDSRMVRPGAPTGFVTMFLWILCGFMATSGIPSTRYMLLFLLLSAINAVLAADWLSYRLATSSGRGTGSIGSSEHNRTVRQHTMPLSIRTGVALVAGVTLPTLAWLWAISPFLSSQHPIAAALTSLVDVEHSVSTMQAVEVALYGAMVPIALLVLLGMRAVYYRVNVLQDVSSGIDRVTGPVTIVLTMAYVAMLNHTLMLDTQASRAISDAARNDLQWVLTHSEDSPTGTRR